MVKSKKCLDFTVRKNKNNIDALLFKNPKIFIKFKNNEYEQIYIDYISKNGNIIIYNKDFEKNHLSDYVTQKRNIKRASTCLRFIYYSLDDKIKYKLYDYLTTITLI